MEPAWLVRPCGAAVALLRALGQRARSPESASQAKTGSMQRHVANVNNSGGASLAATRTAAVTATAAHSSLTPDLLGLSIPGRITPSRQPEFRHLHLTRLPYRCLPRHLRPSQWRRPTRVDSGPVPIVDVTGNTSGARGHSDQGTHDKKPTFTDNPPTSSSRPSSDTSPSPPEDAAGAGKPKRAGRGPDAAGAGRRRIRQADVARRPHPEPFPLCCRQRPCRRLPP